MFINCFQRRNEAEEEMKQLIGHGEGRTPMPPQMNPAIVIGACFGCQGDRWWDTAGLSDGVYECVCPTCKSAENVEVAPLPWILNQIHVKDVQWYSVEKKR